MDSQKAPRYGALAERHARERYDLTAERSAWHDARTEDGEPVEIKAATVQRATGRPGRFRTFREPHRRLAHADGWYAFVAYRPHGAGISVEGMKMVRARTLRPRWRPSGHATAGREEQHKIPISAVF